MQARKIILKHHFDGEPTLNNFELIEETLPATLRDGEILIKADCLSVDPYMRPFGNRMNVGDVMVGSQVATVLKSRHRGFPEGSKVVAYVGWRDVTICSPDTMKGMFSAVLPLPDLKGLPESYALGACGLTGLTAYFGLLKLCQVKSGETVVVSSAAGAVGHIVGQIARLKGCKVVGFAGSDEKVSWIKDELGFKFAFNYKQVHLDSILKKYAVEGVDAYFDNVGGEFTYTVLRNMNDFGRVALCGAISTYNYDPKETYKVPFDYQSMIYKQIKMEGFMVNRWFNEFPEGITQLAEWIHQGKLKVRETRTQGFENMPQAFLDLFKGKNYGKSVIIV